MQEAIEVYAIALSLLKGMTAETVKSFPDFGLSPEDFFTVNNLDLKGIIHFPSPGIWDLAERQKALFEARIQWEKLKNKNVKCLFLLDDDFPYRLYNIPDPPIVLYFIGNANLDSPQMLSMVGTRKPTAYGIDFCNKLVEELSPLFTELTIVSGLAYGIDAASHKAALGNDRPTVAVVAHGLDTIYPASHRQLASDIIRNGGAIVSEYLFGVKPYRQHFLERNRIIAALSDITIVVESDIRGGAMSTANTAFSYSREVMALPGRLSDTLSAGCNHLIKKEKARIITSTNDVIEAAGWSYENNTRVTTKSLFPELTGNAKTIYDILRYDNEPVQLDRLHLLSKIPMPQLMSILGEMEFDGIVTRLPGNRYCIF